MKKLILLGLIFALLLVPNISALTSHSCVEGNLRTNITELNPAAQVEYVWEQPCPDGCVQGPGGTFMCVTASFFIPLELYILFEVIAFIFFFSMLYVHYGTDESNPVIFAGLSMVMFFSVSMMSFNLAGMAFMPGAALNFALAMFSLVYFIINGVNLVPSKI